MNDGAVSFRKPLANAANYPRPSAPNLPVLSLGQLHRRSSSTRGSAFLERTGLFLPSARAGVALALLQTGVKAGSRVLMPAYHCGSLVEPALWTGADVEFYRVDPDLRIDIADVRSRLNRNTRWLVIVHYFGFPQPMSEITKLCADEGLTLIEDCAHAFLSSVDSVPTGSFGDRAVASVTKFFPTDDGGILIGGDVDEAGLPRRCDITRELRSLSHTLRRSASFGRLGPLGATVNLVFSAHDKLRRADSKRTSNPPPKSAFSWFAPSQVGRRGSAISRWIVEHSNVEEIASLRRRNYRVLLERLTGIRAATCLHPQLPDGVVPYVFPLLLKDPASDFPRLKNAGIPTFRWEEVALSDCTVSEAYVEKLVQLPCHQALTSDEVERIVESVSRVLG